MAPPAGVDGRILYDRNIDTKGEHTRGFIIEVITMGSRRGIIKAPPCVPLPVSSTYMPTKQAATSIDNERATIELRSDGMEANLISCTSEVYQPKYMKRRVPRVIGCTSFREKRTILHSGTIPLSRWL